MFNSNKEKKLKSQIKKTEKEIINSFNEILQFVSNLEPLNLHDRQGIRHNLFNCINAYNLGFTMEDRHGIIMWFNTWMNYLTNKNNCNMDFLRFINKIRFDFSKLQITYNTYNTIIQCQKNDLERIIENRNKIEINEKNKYLNYLLHDIINDEKKSLTQNTVN